MAEQKAVAGKKIGLHCNGVVYDHAKADACKEDSLMRHR
jgi:hypothetical protein